MWCVETSKLRVTAVEGSEGNCRRYDALAMHLSSVPSFPGPARSRPKNKRCAIALWFVRFQKDFPFLLLPCDCMCCVITVWYIDRVLKCSTSITLWRCYVRNWWLICSGVMLGFLASFVFHQKPCQWLWEKTSNTAYKVTSGKKFMVQMHPIFVTQSSPERHWRSTRLFFGLNIFINCISAAIQSRKMLTGGLK